MEENKNMNEMVSQANNMGTETEVEGAAGEGKGKKLFTQEEVNGFVQSRIGRMKGQLTKEAQAEYNQKLSDLQSREMKLLVREKLHDLDMPRELADVITCADETDLESKLEVLRKLYGGQSAAKKEQTPKGFLQIGAGGAPQIAGGADPVREAMGLKG